MKTRGPVDTIQYRYDCRYGDSPIASFYGTHITAVTGKFVDTEALTSALKEQNVKMHSLERYFLGRRTASGLIFGYGGAIPNEITEGLSILRKTLAHDVE